MRKQIGARSGSAVIAHETARWTMIGRVMAGWVIAAGAVAGCSGDGDARPCAGESCAFTDAGLVAEDAAPQCECFPPHAIGRCIDGACTVHGCLDGHLDCDGDATNGCEVDPTTDVFHCGACGVACTVAAHGAPVCARGSCVADCDEGYLDCDGNPANGCERAMVAYGDADGDGVGVAADWHLVCEIGEGLSARGDDCDDADDRVFPGQTRCFQEPSAVVGFDYDCDGARTRCLTDVGYCGGCGGEFGWTGGVPDCGGSGTRVTGLSMCACMTSTGFQSCR